MPDSQAAVAQTPFEQFRPALAAGRPWRKVGMCFGSLAVVAAVSLMTLKEKPVAPRTASAFDLAPESGTPQVEMAEAGEPEPSIQDIASVLPEPPTEPEAPDFGLPYVEAAIQLRKGDTVARVLDRLGISAADGAEIVAALARHVRLDRPGAAPEAAAAGGGGGDAARGPVDPHRAAPSLHARARRRRRLQRRGGGLCGDAAAAACRGPGRGVGDRQRRGRRRAAWGAGGNAARFLVGRELPARHQGRRPLRRIGRARLDERRDAGRRGTRAVGGVDDRWRRRALQHLPVQAARRRGVLLQQRWGERDQVAAANAAEHEPHLLALRPASASGARVQPAACRHRLRRAAGHADTCGRCRSRHRSRGVRRLW